MIEITEYVDKYAADFKRLNLEWLDKYHLTESHDLMILDNPRKYILDTGGVIYLALDGQQVVASAAIIDEGHGTFELAKMAVQSEYQGRGISKMLIEKCLQAAREKGAARIILFSNHQLKTALGLYEKYGFRHVEVEDSPFATADVKMELTL